jgi:hypothetical protein
MRPTKESKEFDSQLGTATQSVRIARFCRFTARVGETKKSAVAEAIEACDAIYSSRAATNEAALIGSGQDDP